MGGTWIWEVMLLNCANSIIRKNEEDGTVICKNKTKKKENKVTNLNVTEVM